MICLNACPCRTCWFFYSRYVGQYSYVCVNFKLVIRVWRVITQIHVCSHTHTYIYKYKVPCEVITLIRQTQLWLTFIKWMCQESWPMCPPQWRSLYTHTTRTLIPSLSFFNLVFPEGSPLHPNLRNALSKHYILEHTIISWPLSSMHVSVLLCLSLSICYF